MWILCQHATRFYRQVPTFIFVIFWLALQSASHGATRTWTGGGTTGNWSTGNNWGGNAPAAGDNLVFPANATRFNNTNDIVGRAYNSITISGSNYVIQGNSLTVSNNLSAQNVSGTNVFVPAMTLGKPQTVECTLANATLVLAGTLDLGTNNTIFNAVGRLQITNSISGSGAVTKNGAGLLRYEGMAANTYTNVTTINGGTLELAKSAATALAGAVAVGNGSVAATLRNLFADQIADTVNITINRFAIWDMDNSDETIGGLTLSGGTNTTGLGTLTLAGNVTVLASASTATISGSLSLGGTTRIFDVAAGAASPDLLIAAIVSDGGGSAGIFQSNSGQLMLSGANIYTGPTTVNGVLTLANDSALGANGSVGSGTTVNTGGLLLVAGLNIGNEFLTLNNTANFQSTGTASWAGPITLNGSAFFDVFPGSFTNSGVISGSGGITKGQGGTLIFSGASANTYLGNTVVNQGVLQLSKSVPGAIQNGMLTIGDDAGGNDADVVRCTADAQLSSTVAINLNSSGLLDLNNFAGDIGALAIAGGHVATGTGTLTLSGDITVNPNANNFGRIDGGLLLNATRIFNVSDGPFSPDLQIAASISGAGGLTKNGGGELSLSASNSYASLTTINSGFIDVFDSFALGSTSAGTIVNSGAALALDNGVHVGLESLTLNGSGIGAFAALSGSFGSNSWDGTINLGGDASVSATSAGDFLNLAGAIVGSGNLSKNGAGTVIFSGVSANTFTGTTFANDGTLLLAKNVVDGAIPGNLTIGNGGAALSDVVRLSNGAQIADTSVVTINGSGLFDLNGISESVGTLSGTGRVDLASGTLNLNANGSAVFSGVITGAGGNVTKNGSGVLTLNGNHTYSGSTVINDGTLIVNGSQPASAVTVGTTGTLGGRGTVGNITSTGGRVNPGASPGMLTSSNLSLNASSVLTVELNGPTAGVDYDQLNVRGTVNLGGAQLVVQPGGSFAPSEGQQFTIINNDGVDAVVGTFAGLPNNSIFISESGLRFAVRYGSVIPNDVVLTVTNTAVRISGMIISGGNGNGGIDANECNFLSIVLTNITAGTLNGVIATLIPKTPNVSVSSGTATYSSLAPGDVGTNSTLFQFGTSPGFICGTTVQFDLAVNTASDGTFTIPISIPGLFPCANVGGACESCPDNRTISGLLGSGSLAQTGRLVRLFTTVNCSSVKTCPGTIGAVVNHYDAYTFENGESNACVTVTLTAPCDLFSAVYSNQFNAGNLCQNYISDIGTSTGTNGVSSYSFNMPARARFVIVVSEVDAGGCAYTLRVMGGSCRPALKIARTSGGSVVFEWSSSAFDYGLERGHVLTNPPQPAWAPVGLTPTILNGRLRVTNSVSGSNWFYQLRKP